MTRPERARIVGKYIVLYQAPLSVAERFAQATPAEAMAGMQLWVDWARKLGPALVHPGRPLGNAVRVTQDGIAKAPDMDAALAMVSDHHHLRWAPECEILVLEEMPIPEQQAR